MKGREYPGLCPLYRPPCVFLQPRAPQQILRKDEKSGKDGGWEQAFSLQDSSSQAPEGRGILVSLNLPLHASLGAPMAENHEVVKAVPLRKKGPDLHSLTHFHQQSSTALPPPASPPPFTGPLVLSQVTACHWDGWPPPTQDGDNWIAFLGAKYSFVAPLRILPVLQDLSPHSFPAALKPQLCPLTLDPVSRFSVLSIWGHFLYSRDLKQFSHSSPCGGPTPPETRGCGEYFPHGALGGSVASCTGE